MNNPAGHGELPPDIDPEEFELFRSLVEIHQSADEAERFVRAVTAGVNALEDLRISVTLTEEALARADQARQSRIAITEP